MNIAPKQAGRAGVESKQSVAVCPICQGTNFSPAPNGRMSRRGLAPRCMSCKSLERDRAGRSLMEALRDRELFKTFKLLQFGNDRIVAKGWFRESETSVFGSIGAHNPMAIDRPNESFDCVVSSHVITKVEDHRAAVREIARLLSRRGLAFLSYPLPGLRTVTSDWGFPDPKQSGNFRILGEDFEPALVELASGTRIAAVKAIDPVTKDADLVYLMTKDFSWMRKLISLRLDARFLDAA